MLPAAAGSFGLCHVACANVIGVHAAQPESVQLLLAEHHHRDCGLHTHTAAWPAQELLHLSLGARKLASQPPSCACAFNPVPYQQAGYRAQ